MPPMARYAFFLHIVLGNCTNWLARATELHALQFKARHE
jgi:hypothetical protein